MNVILYPLHLYRKFKRRWTAKVVQDESQRPPSREADGCSVCGRRASAPVHSTYLPTGNVVNQWRCSQCRNSWQTSEHSVEDPLSQSEHLRESARLCRSLEGTAPDDAARKQLRRMSDAWLALAETQEWLDGKTAPVSRPLTQGVQA